MPDIRSVPTLALTFRPAPFQAPKLTDDGAEYVVQRLVFDYGEGLAHRNN
jgi:hypothetical protein